MTARAHLEHSGSGWSATTRLVIHPDVPPYCDQCGQPWPIRWHDGQPIPGGYRTDRPNFGLYCSADCADVDGSDRS